MRLALRSLAKSPGFALAVVLTLALGIGANTAVFSVLRGVMLRPLPHRDGDRLLYLRQSAANTGQQDIWFSVPEIADIRAGAPSLAAVGEFSSLTFNLIGAGEPVQVQAGIVTGNFFEVMGLGAVVGRTLDRRDDGPAAAPALMVHGRTHRMTEVFGRLAPGATVEQARAEIAALTARLRREHPDAYDPGA